MTLRENVVLPVMLGLLEDVEHAEVERVREGDGVRLLVAEELLEVLPDFEGVGVWLTDRATEREFVREREDVGLMDTLEHRENTPLTEGDCAALALREKNTVPLRGPVVEGVVETVSE